MTRLLRIGLLSAMPEEIGSDLTHLEAIDQRCHGDFTLHRCRWQGSAESPPIQLSLAWSGWGKVCAARAATPPCAIAATVLTRSCRRQASTLTSSSLTTTTL